MWPNLRFLFSEGVVLLIFRSSFIYHRTIKTDLAILVADSKVFIVKRRVLIDTASFIEQIIYYAIWKFFHELGWI